MAVAAWIAHDCSGWETADRLVLDRADLEATKGKANRSGRYFGGAPLRGDYGNGKSNGRGRGQISYSDSRPNPFAAHINPNYAPPGVANNSRGLTTSQPPYGWLPQPPGAHASRGGPPPPPPLGGGVPYGHPPPPQQYGYCETSLEEVEVDDGGRYSSEYGYFSK